MLKKYLGSGLIFFIATVLFWLLALFIPQYTGLFFILRNIFIVLTLILVGMLLGMLLLTQNLYYNMECPYLEKEPFELLLSDGVRLYGAILTGQTDDASPVVLVCHGWIGSIEQIYPYAYPLVVQGYKVVCYNHRGHGLKPHKSGGIRTEIDKTFMDVQQVVDFIMKRPDLNHQRLGAIGFSLGGYTLLTGGYIDPRLKLIIAVCAGHDWQEMLQYWAWYVRFFFRLTGLKTKISEELNRKLSPKYFLQKKMDKIVCLAHAKNDIVVPFSGFLKNKELLQLPTDQTIEFNTGDHGFFGQGTVLESQILKWFNQYL
jgi:dipeptidyl aminopeptidase/acylaminoacyl peptidase